MKKIGIISIICIMLDQLFKYLVINNIAFASSIHIIRNFFRLTYVQNTGGAFSIFSNNIILLIVITIIVLGTLIYLIRSNKKISKLDIVIYGLLLGGIIGNLIDRIFRGYVIDYLDFNFGSYNFPVFNLADICIVISCIGIIFKILKEGD